MRVIVHMISVGSSLNAVKHTLEIYCGSGEQLVRWLGVTACARMAYDTKGLLGTHVPQASGARGRAGQPLRALQCVYPLHSAFGGFRRTRAMGNGRRTRQPMSPALCRVC